MQPDVAKAQAATLAQWAEEWDRDAVAGDGAGEVAFALRKAAAAIAVSIGEDVEPDAPALPVIEPTSAVRDG